MSNQLLIVISDAVASRLSYHNATDCPQSWRHESGSRLRAATAWRACKAELQAQGLLEEFRAAGNYLVS